MVAYRMLHFSMSVVIYFDTVQHCLIRSSGVDQSHRERHRAPIRTFRYAVCIVRTGLPASSCTLRRRTSCWPCHRHTTKRTGTTGRAFPDLNQGHADLQSAVLATELYTHVDVFGMLGYTYFTSACGQLMVPRSVRMTTSRKEGLQKTCKMLGNFYAWIGSAPGFICLES